ncbi:MAG: hypothetical protein KKI09_04260 [Spirochaetes bacterium]|nr:hypothetical protein [Spirochaetota bacterium]MBU0954623.1 hypothetical protein [Spirochaetota bacterium]
MQLDVITLYWVLGLSYAANLIFAVLLYNTGILFRGARLWLSALLSLALGVLLLAGRTGLPYPVLALGNTLIISAYVLYAHAAWSFKGGKRFRLWFYLAIPLFLFLFMVPLRNAPVNLRTAWLSIFSIVGSVAIFVILDLRIRDCHYRGAWWAALPFLIVALGNTIQLYAALRFPDTFSINQMNPVYPVVILFSVLTAPISLFGYFLLAGLERQEYMEKQQEIIRASNVMLRKTNQTKDMFVSILAHDLRNPLAGAARYVRKNLLADGVDLDQKKVALETLAVSLEKTHVFLENVLWWSRAQREDWAGKKTELNLDEILQIAIAMILPMAHDKNITITVSGGPVMAFADSDSVLLILHNLLSNALKFSLSGTVVETGTILDSNGQPCLFVTDHGIGIKPELREKLLQIETKISTPGTRGETGSGMGLILCWEFARLNDARLILTSEPGIGTTVRLTFKQIRP